MASEKEVTRLRDDVETIELGLEVAHKNFVEARDCLTLWQGRRLTALESLKIASGRESAESEQNKVAKASETGPRYEAPSLRNEPLANLQAEQVSTPEPQHNHGKDESMLGSVEGCPACEWNPARDGFDYAASQSAVPPLEKSQPKALCTCGHRARSHGPNWHEESPEKEATGFPVCHYPGCKCLNYCGPKVAEPVVPSPEPNYSTKLAPVYLAEQIFFHVLLRGGVGNPFRTINSKWFVETAAPKIRELLTASLPSTQGEGWVKVEERLPEVGGTYLVRVHQPDLPDDATHFGYFIHFEDGPKWSITGVWPDRHQITHWRALPSPPQREKK